MGVIYKFTKTGTKRVIMFSFFPSSYFFYIKCISFLKILLINTICMYVCMLDP